MNFLKQAVTSLITAYGKRIESKRFSEVPIYIGGCGRSGTTLLLSILSAHNDIFACPRELNLFFDAEMKEGEVYLPKIHRLYRAIMFTRIKQSAIRYCEKSPANVQRIEAIDTYHQGRFKLIHIIRDGRDVVLSKHPTKKEEYWVEPARWVRDVSLGLEKKDHPCVHTIRYEDLINEFEGTIRRICDFLGIPVSDEILNWHQYTTVRKNRALYSPIQEISSSSIAKYERMENKDRLDEFMENEKAVELLKSLGY